MSRQREPRPLRYEWEGVLRRLALPPSVKLVAAFCAQYGNLDGAEVRPGVDRLALETTHDERTVRTAMTALRDLGLLTRVRCGSAQGRRGLADEYRLTIPDDVADRVADWNAHRGREPHGLVDDDQWGAHLTRGARRPRASPVDNPPEHRASSPLFHPEQWVSDPLIPGNTGSQIHGTPGVRPAHQTTDHTSMTPTPKPVVHVGRPLTSRDPPVDKPQKSSRRRKCPHGNDRRRRRDGTPRCDQCRTQGAAA